MKVDIKRRSIIYLTIYLESNWNKWSLFTFSDSKSSYRMKHIKFCLAKQSSIQFLSI